jgi:RNA polymerase sigma-70 factor (ECF subfamily)
MAPPQPACDLPDTVVDAARRGDRAAITTLYEHLAPVVRGYLRGAGASDPDSLTGDVFVGVVRGLPAFAGGGAALRTWVFTIAHRRLVDDRRRQRRRREAPLDDAVLVSFPTPDAYDAVLDGIAAHPVRTALAALTAEQRAVLLLRFVGGFTVAEAADVLAKSVPAVKMLQQRALAALARNLSPASRYLAAGSSDYPADGNALLAS